MIALLRPWTNSPICVRVKFESLHLMNQRSRRVVYVRISAVPIDIWRERSEPMLN